jgi:hypothetical protein
MRVRPNGPLRRSRSTAELQFDQIFRAASAAISISLLSGSVARAIGPTVSGLDGSTIQASGPVSGAANDYFFDVAGTSSSASASFGVMTFPGADYGNETLTSISELNLQMIEEDSAATAAGIFDVYVTTDYTTNSDSVVSPGLLNAE